MSGKVEREKILSQKVMLSLLMAGTMSVCISGGDVWAKTVYVADGSEVSINEDVGGDIIAGQFLNKDGQINCSDSLVTEVKSLSGQALQQAANNNLQTHLIFAGTLSSGDEIIGGSYDRIGSGMLTVAGTQIDFSGTAGAITGGGKAASQKGSNSSAANSRVSGNTVINIDGGSIGGLVAGGGSAKSNVSDTNTTADVGGNTAIHVSGGELGGLVGGGYAYAYNSVNVQAAARVEGTAAIVINAGQINKIKDTNVAKFNDAAIAGGGLAMSSSTQTSAASAYVGAAQITIAGGTVSGNVYGGGLAVNAGSSAIAGSTQVTIVGGEINGRKIYGGGLAYGAGSEAVTGNTSLILTAADTGIDCIYGGGYAVEGGKVTTGNTHIVIDIAGNGKGAEDIFGGNSVYAFPGGTNAQGIVGDTLIEYKNGTSRGMVFGGSEIMGYTSATNDISKVESGNTAIFVTGGTLTEAVLGGSKVRLTGDQANKISSTGKDATVIVSGASVKGLVGGDLVQVLKKTYDKPVRIAEGSVEKTNIIVNGGTVGTLYVDAGASIQIGDAGFKGAIIGGGVATGGTDENKHALSSVDTANVVINDGIVNGDVYGGGLSTATLRSGNEADGGISTVASANVTMNGGIVNGDIYGGGAAVGAGTYDGGSSSVQNAVVNISGGTVNGSVYGGGYSAGSNVAAKVEHAALNVKGYNGSIQAISGFDRVDITDSDLTTNLQAINKKVAVALNGTATSLKGTLTADGAELKLGGTGGLYAADKISTANEGKIIVSGGTLNIDNITTDKFALLDNSLMVSDKGVLQAAAGTVFEFENDSVKVKAAVSKQVDFNGGKLAVSDATYTLQQSTGYSKALKQAAEQDNGKTMLVLTGTLVDGTGNAVTEAKADDLAYTGVIHSAVTGQVADNGAVAVGNKDFGVKDLALGTGNNSVTISGDGTSGALTLVGSSSAGTELVKTSSAAADVKVEIKDGATLNLGVAGTDSGGKLTGSVNISDANSKINVDAGTFEITKVEASLGTVAINSGAVLKTDKMEVGTAVANINGAAEVKELKAAAGSAINVGTGDSAGSLAAGNAELHGAAVVLDPVWQGNDTIGQASKAALTFINNSVDGLMTVGRNSVLSLGTDDTAKAETAFSETGLTWGEKGVSAALYIDRAQQLAASGGLYIDGNKDTAAANGNEATFAAGSLLIVNGAGIGTSGTAALTGGTYSKLTVADCARLYLTSTNAGTYVITDNFTNSSSITGWSADAAKAEVSVNKLSEIEKVEQDAANGKYTVTVKQKDVQKTYDGISLPHILQAMDQSKTEYAGIKYLTELANDTGLSPSEFVAAVNDFARGAENSGASRSSALAAAEIGNAVQEHLSFANLGGEIPAGLGRGADQAERGNIWAQYLYNKDKVNDLGGVSYDAQYNGVVIGGDFAPQGKYSSGVAFSYGSGSSTGSASKNEFDFWGLSYYGSVRNADTNLIFDAGYSKTSSEFKGVVKAEPSVQVFTLGIKGEQSYDGGHGTRFVPYAGLRYLHIDADAYTGTIGGSAAARYSPDKADVWLLPLGINISHVSSGADGWRLRPSIDLAYVWALGDRDNLMSVTVPGIDAGDRVGYEWIEKGFFAGRLGLEAVKDDWSYGVSYSYQKGNAAQSSKWFVNVQYSF